MIFDILTIFPRIFDSYFGESILKRAQKVGQIKINTIDIRDFTHDARKTVDDTPYGGGAGMIMKIEPIFEALEDNRKKIGEKEKVRTILFSAKGKLFTQKDAERLAEYDRLVMICGRYEGVDERVKENLVDEEISIGSYVLTGGEIPAMIDTDAVSRLIPGVLGNAESLEEESFSMSSRLLRQSADTARSESLSEIKNFEEIREYPQYTKPEEFFAKGEKVSWKVPEVLLSGHHENIKKWREEQRKQK